MRIYFAQHGLALSKDENPERPLSPAGRQQTEAVAAHLQRCGVQLAAVCHSGKTRARQTAQIFADHLGAGTVEELAGMNPNDNVAEFAAALPQTDNAMYVGHLPHMGKLVPCLTTGNENAGVVQFTNAGVVCLVAEPGACHILWYLTPELCTAHFQRLL